MNRLNYKIEKGIIVLNFRPKEYRKNGLYVLLSEKFDKDIIGPWVKTDIEEGVRTYPLLDQHIGEVEEVLIRLENNG